MNLRTNNINKTETIKCKTFEHSFEAVKTNDIRLINFHKVNNQARCRYMYDVQSTDNNNPLDLA